MAWFYYESRKSERKSKEQADYFLIRERKANLTRRADLSSLPYIKVPTTVIPTETSGDAILATLCETLQLLSNKPILNLSSLSNTELKEQYGVANLSYLSECDSNYALLITTITKCASHLYEISRIDEAVSLLTYAVSITCDSSQVYRLLGTIYKEQDNHNALDDLILQVPDSVFTKDALITYLKTLSSSF